MATFRVEKSKDYTVMSNHHLRNADLSLKAKGLLSQMLSLPENWDYTLAGLAAINRESKDAIRSAVQELEQAGYIQRRQTQDANGKFSVNEYIIREYPVSEAPLLENPTTDDPSPETPSLENPSTGKPSTEKPSPGKPLTENPTELNIDISSKDICKKKSKKEKAPKPGYVPLTDEALRALVFEGIQRMATPVWSREEKNTLYRHLLELYDPGREVRKAHPMRTSRSVNGTFAKLVKWAGNDVSAMIEIVSTALENGWQGIQPPGGSGFRRDPPPSRSDPVEYF